MKRLLALGIVFSLFILSCQTESKKGSSKNNKPDIDNRLALNEFAETFGGVWIPKNYLDAINKHKSAYLSRDEIPFISQLKIHKSNLKDDTLWVESGLNNHEGYDFKIWKSAQSAKNEFASSILEWEKGLNLIFRYNLADTSISILMKNAFDSLVERIDFTRVLGSENAYNSNETAYDYMSRKLILTGKYQILDASKKDLGIAEFEPLEGKITGFKHGYYTFSTDFIAGVFYPSDYILLRPEFDNYSDQEFLAMIHRNDTLFIYETVDIITDSSYDVELGNIKYYLTDKN